jgi:hypothetical protein
MRIAASLVLAAAIASSARAQPAEPPTPPRPAQPAKANPSPDDDIIGSLLDPRHKPTAAEEEEPDTAGQTRAAPEAELPLPAPGAPVAAMLHPPAPQPQRDRPVFLQDTSKTPDRPPSDRDLAYEARVRASFAAAEGFQGRLDGGWTLSEVRRGGDAFAFQIVDRSDRLEAVWRDLRRAGSLDGSGVVDAIQRAGATLTLRFTEAQTIPVAITLIEKGDGRWTGQLARGDEVFDVALRRTGP